MEDLIEEPDEGKKSNDSRGTLTQPSLMSQSLMSPTSLIDAFMGTPSYRHIIPSSHLS